MDDLPHVDGVEHIHVDADGVRLHVATAGPQDGPVAVLLHGWPQHWWMWRAQLGDLAAAGFRVLAPDLRGFGWSDVPPRGYDKQTFADDVLAALDGLGVERFAVAGHDWGGYTAQLVALAAPERVTHLGILNIIPVFRNLRGSLPNAWRGAYQLPLITPGLGVLVQRRQIRRFMLGVDPAAQDVYAARFRDPARARAGQQVYRDFLRRDLPAAAARKGRFAMPTLVLHGRRDPVVRPAMVAGFEGRGDDLRIEVVPEAGHFIVDQCPELVSERLAAHFRT